MANVRGPLGCASDYQAQIVWRENGRVFGSPVLDGVTDVGWSRSLNDVSEATVTIARQGNDPACCGILGEVTPWVHELLILRDGVRVWEGPVIKVTEGRSEIVLEAKDVFAYLDRCKNTFKMRYVEATPDEEGRRRGQVTWIAEHILHLNLELSSLSQPPDYPRIMEYIVRRDSSKVIKYEKDGSSNTSVWAEYVGNILRALNKRGLHWTTVGRTLYLIAGLSENDPPLARLGLDDILGDLQVITDGNALATASWAHDQDQQDISKGRAVGTGYFGTAYGRVDLITRVDEEEPDEEDLREAARSALAGRYPIPWAISMPENSQLHPDTPLDVNDLVCGERVDVSTQGMCTELLQPFRISDVEGTWSQKTGEKIAITLVPPNALSGDTPAPGD
ncbi:hypothetical protein DY218_27295 [Streptomyces triticagri]|uniref:Minor tail protein n=1 Tax=Streptomyces triticagri TaxID=2293568 RepID=A0A372LZC9_9ACTN|nr:hypothetical protein [Streptomyces triticagri]RFU83615.1 hypothetical protein DY218_27295 [Streptomyces triticagri]